MKIIVSGTIVDTDPGMLQLEVSHSWRIAALFTDHELYLVLPFYRNAYTPRII
jgi:hypothetical protein